MCLDGAFPEVNDERRNMGIRKGRKPSRLRLPREQRKRGQFGCILFVAVAGVPLGGVQEPREKSNLGEAMVTP